MKELLAESIFFGMALSLICYEIGNWIKKKTGFWLANPLLIGGVLAILVLVAADIDYASYYNGAKYIQYLLTPATVSLAIPLYRQLSYLKKYPLAIFGGILAGVVTSLVGVWALSLAFGLTQEQYVSLLPKSITTAIGMSVSEKMGGIVGLTVLSIVITGVLGNVLAERICKFCRITEPVAKGLAIGTSAHALGTSRAMEIGEVEGAMSSLAIVVAGIMTVILVPIFV